MSDSLNVMARMLESLMVTCGKDAVLRVSIPTLLTKMVVSSALRLVKSAGITSNINIVVVLISTKISMEVCLCKFPRVYMSF